MNWEQFKAILWLRSRLTARQLKKGGAIQSALAALSVVAGLVLAVGALAGGFAFAYGTLRAASAQSLLLVWDVVVAMFVFFWMIGAATELQRSESLDLTRMLHLPVSLKGAFIFNYAASHFTLSLMIAIPLALGLVLGMAIGRGWSWMLMFPLVLGLIFAMTSWTYCIRGWLAAIMTNPRKKRSIVVGLGVGIMLLAQLPNLYFNFIARWDAGGRQDVMVRKTADRASLLWSPEGLMAHWFMPPAWVGRCSYALAGGAWFPTILCTAGFVALGWSGLAVSYRSTLKAYRGEEKPLKKGVEAKGESVTSKLGLKRARFMSRRIVGMPEQASAVVLAGLRSLFRAPELRGMMVSQLVFVLVLSFMLLGGRRSGAWGEFKVFATLPLIAMTSFGVLQLFYNQFGFDRDGFRSFILAPIPRHLLLLGRNVTLLPLPMVLTGLMVLLGWGTGMLSGWQVLATPLQWMSFMLLLCLVGNVVSIALPYRIASGSMRPTKTTFLTGLVMFVVHMTFPLLLLPVFVGVLAAYLSSRALEWPVGPVLLLLSLLVLLASGVVYFLSLEPMGRWLQRRERDILQVVTQEVE